MIKTRIRVDEEENELNSFKARFINAFENVYGQKLWLFSLDELSSFSEVNKKGINNVYGYNIFFV